MLIRAMTEGKLKAQKKREEQERQEQEQAAKEKKEWEDSWTTFVTGWIAFRGMTAFPPLLVTITHVSLVIRSQSRPFQRV